MIVSNRKLSSVVPGREPRDRGSYTNRHMCFWPGSIFSRLQYASMASGTVLCEDGVPFLSSKTEAACLAAFLFTPNAPRA